MMLNNTPQATMPSQWDMRRSTSQLRVRTAGERVKMMEYRNRNEAAAISRRRSSLSIISWAHRAAGLPSCPGKASFEISADQGRELLANFLGDRIPGCDDRVGQGVLAIAVALLR